MRVLAVADTLIGPAAMKEGLSLVPELVQDLTIREWHHDSIAAMQEDNLAVELRGPGAIEVPPEIFANIDSFEVIITQFCPITSSVIEAAKSARVIGVLRAGVENVDHQAAEARGIHVVNAPGRNANAVAEFSVGLILAETRNITRAQIEMLNGTWDRRYPNIEAVRELNGSHVGLVGLGQIGQIVARLLTAFGSRVSYCDPYTEFAEYPRVSDVGDLAADVDILSLHTRLTPATRHIISAEVISRMKPSAVLVNTARSGLVDEPALIKALENRQIMGAAIDTFDIEPLPVDSPFLKLDNVTLTTHLAGTTLDAIKRTPQILALRLASQLGL